MLVKSRGVILSSGINFGRLEGQVEAIIIMFFFFFNYDFFVGPNTQDEGRSPQMNQT